MATKEQAPRKYQANIRVFTDSDGLLDRELTKRAAQVVNSAIEFLGGYDSPPTKIALAEHLGINRNSVPALLSKLRIRMPGTEPD